MDLKCIFISAVLALTVILAASAGCVSDYNSDYYNSGYNPGDDFSGEDLPLSVHFINVGQADCILIEQSGNFALIDAGKPMKSSDGITTPMDYLEKEGVKKLDFLLTTHQDYDHIGYAVCTMEKFETDTFYDNGVTHTSKTYENLLEYVLDENIHYEVVKSGDTLDSNFVNVTFDVIHPRMIKIKDGNKEDINQNSIVVKLTYHNATMLLTGDAEEEAESYIIDYTNDIDADVLKVGHHGSKASSSGKFLKKVDPEYAVISVGEGNSYGHPAASTVQRIKKYVGDKIYYTYDGTVIFTTTGDNWFVTQN